MVIIEVSEDVVDERGWCMDGGVGAGGEYGVFCAVAGGGEDRAAGFCFASGCERSRKGGANKEKEDI